MIASPDKNHMVWTEFESWQEVIDVSEGPWTNGHKPERQSSRDHAPKRSWDANTNYEQAVELARKGWPKGSQKVADIADRIGTVVGERVKVATPTYSVAGASVDVGRYLSGEPECMISFDDVVQEGRGRIVSIVANASVSHYIDSDTVQRRGAAVLALVEALQATGHSVEFTLVHGVQEDSKFIRSIPMKRPDEALDVDSLAFATVHPASLRRIMFSVREHEPDRIREASGVNGYGYGSPYDLSESDPREKALRGDIYVPIPRREKFFDTDEHAVDWVLARLKEQGVDIEEDTGKTQR